MRLASKQILVMVIVALSGCKTTRQDSDVKADGASWGVGNLSNDTFDAIKSACDDPRGARDLGLTVEECYLIMAGSTVRESSWNARKYCEAWGNPGDPCCGLTQSRRMDAQAVGLRCNPAEQSPAGYSCNVLTGLRNIGCKASNGKDCQHHSSDGSLYTGVRKHLGYNTGNVPSYVNDMKNIYERGDIRARFGINNAATRSWNDVFYGSASQRQNSAPSQFQQQQQQQQQQQSGYPTCSSAASDPDGDGWGYENNKSCRVSGR
jgi:hypothetical protein